MPSNRRSRLLRAGAVLLALGAWIPASADEKEGMPDLAQVEQTCLPTSTANLMIWFGKHGYPKLIMNGATQDERELHTVHQVMTDTDARFDWGTRMDDVTVGIRKYIQDAGYPCDVEYRGMNGQGQPFSEDWLKENDAPNKGFILLLLYCHMDPMRHVFTPAWNAGHAVTLVNADPDAMLIHDPAHQDDETGRKIITPYVLHDGTWTDYQGTQPVAGLMLLTGSLLEAPDDAMVMVSGAVCVTMHPAGSHDSSRQADGAPASTLGGTVGSGPVSSGGTSQGFSWYAWVFNLLFDK